MTTQAKHTPSLEQLADHLEHGGVLLSEQLRSVCKAAKSAPDLLSACKQALEVLAMWDRSLIAMQAHDAIYDAIAKAEGGAE